MTADVKFAFVVPTFNASSTVSQMLLSVACQSYGNWRVLIQDDVSSDRTAEVVWRTARHLGVDNRVKVKSNVEKKWEVQNVLEMLEDVDDDEVVCRLDGDDYLCDVDALAIIADRYRKSGVKCLWTSHRWGLSGINISGPMPRSSDPYVHPWVSSHLKTFRRGLLRDVKDVNFRNQEGEYYKRIGDQAIYLPALRMSGGNWHHEPITAYHYRIDISPGTFQTDDAKLQRDEAVHLRQRGFIT